MKYFIFTTTVVKIRGADTLVVKGSYMFYTRTRTRTHACTHTHTRTQYSMADGWSHCSCLSSKLPALGEPQLPPAREACMLPGQGCHSLPLPNASRKLGGRNGRLGAQKQLLPEGRSPETHPRARRRTTAGRSAGPRLLRRRHEHPRHRSPQARSQLSGQRWPCHCLPVLLSAIHIHKKGIFLIPSRLGCHTAASRLSLWVSTPCWLLMRVWSSLIHTDKYLPWYLLHRPPFFFPLREGNCWRRRAGGRF